MFKYSALQDSLNYSAKEMLNILNEYLLSLRSHIPNTSENPEDLAKITQNIQKESSIVSKIISNISAKQRTFLTNPAASATQVNLIKEIRKGFDFCRSNFILKSNNRLPYIQQTITTAFSLQSYSPTGFQSTQNRKNQIQTSVPNLSVVEINGKKWIKILGLNIDSGNQYSNENPYPNPFTVSLKSQLGENIYIDGREIRVRATSSVWEKFVDLARWYIDKHEEFSNPNILSQLEQDNITEHSEEGQKRFDVTYSDDDLSIKFDKSKPYYIKDIGKIVNYIYSELQIELKYFGTDWNNGVLYFAKPKDATESNKVAFKLYTLKRKLSDHQGFNYNTQELNGAIKSVFGISDREAFNISGEDIKSKRISDKIVSNSLKRNLLSEPFTSSRFNGKKDVDTIVRTHYTSKGEVDHNLPYGPNNWVGLFGKDTIAKQNEMQSQGINFIISRKSAILADTPGSGKTPTAIVAADIVRENGQKILVITPNNLLKQNWIGNEAKGPMFFCGHDRSQVVEVSNKDELDEAIKNPNSIWIVVKQSTFKQSQSADDLCNAIRVYSDSKIFSSLIIDEIQEYKDTEDSIAYERMQKAINWDGINFRFGLSGTPADNAPSNMYSQLRLIRHPVVNDGGGDRAGYTQNTDGFAEQFLGGSDLSEIISFSRERISDSETKEIKSGWVDKCYNVLTWAESLKTPSKENILNLFDTTFLRRDKKDIKDLPVSTDKIKVDAIPVPPKEMMDSKSWKNDISQFNAMAKTDATVAKAIELLKKDPTRQIFIATQYIATADAIEAKINEQLGEGSAKAIHSGIKNVDKREEYVSRFKSRDNTTFKVIIYTFALGAVGLNFNNCDTAILNDLHPNPSVNLQAEYRINRMDSKKPISIYYTQFDENQTSAAANYDRNCFTRIEQKKKINEEILNIMKKVKTVKGKDREKLVEKFVENVIKNILVDLQLDSHTKEFFFSNLEKALRGEKIEPLENIKINKMKDSFLEEDLFLYEYVHKSLKEDFENAKTLEDTERAIISIRQEIESLEQDITSHYGKHIDDLSREELENASKYVTSKEFTQKKRFEVLKKIYKTRYGKIDVELDGFEGWLEEEDPKIYSLFYGNKDKPKNWFKQV